MSVSYSVGVKGTKLRLSTYCNIIFSWRLAVFLGLASGVDLGPARGSDHSDAPQSGGLLRQDANLTDLHAFVVGENLVIALSMNPAIPPSAASYTFPTDLTFEINIDNDSAVEPWDPTRMGGTIVDRSEER